MDDLLIVLKEDIEKSRKRRFKSMSSKERQDLILKKMKAIGIKSGSGVPDKTYNSTEVRDLIRIANCFPELRNKG